MAEGLRRRKIELTKELAEKFKKLDESDLLSETASTFSEHSPSVHLHKSVRPKPGFGSKTISYESIIEIVRYVISPQRLKRSLAYFKSEDEKAPCTPASSLGIADEKR